MPYAEGARGAGADISQVEIITTEDKKAILHFFIDITDTEHFEKVSKIEKAKGVLQARRVRKG